LPQWRLWPKLLPQQRRRRAASKIEQILKSEIIRLAWKPIRGVCVPLARNVRQLKRQV